MLTLDSGVEVFGIETDAELVGFDDEDHAVDPRSRFVLLGDHVELFHALEFSLDTVEESSRNSSWRVDDWVRCVGDANGVSSRQTSKR